MPFSHNQKQVASDGVHGGGKNSLAYKSLNWQTAHCTSIWARVRNLHGLQSAQFCLQSDWLHHQDDVHAWAILVCARDTRPFTFPHPQEKVRVWVQTSCLVPVSPKSLHILILHPWPGAKSGVSHHTGSAAMCLGFLVATTCKLQQCPTPCLIHLTGIVDLLTVKSEISYCIK